MARRPCRFDGLASLSRKFYIVFQQNLAFIKWGPESRTPFSPSVEVSTFDRIHSQRHQHLQPSACCDSIEIPVQQSTKTAYAGRLHCGIQADNLACLPPQLSRAGPEQRTGTGAPRVSGRKKACQTGQSAQSDQANGARVVSPPAAPSTFN